MAIEDLYDVGALRDYVAQQQGAGLVPEFTNIPGAAGFFVDDVSPPNLDEEDPLAELPDIESFTDSYSAKETHRQLSQELDIKKETRQRELELAAGIEDLRSNVVTWKATGLANSPLVQDTEKQIIAKEQEIKQTLALDERGYRDAYRYLDRLSDKADQLAPPLTPEQRFILADKAGISGDDGAQLTDNQLKMAATITGQERQPAIALINAGLQIKHGQIASKYLGHTPTDLDIASWNKDTKSFLINEEESGGTTTLTQVLGEIPDSFDMYVKKLPLDYDKAEAALMLQEATALKKDVLKAKAEATIPKKDKTPSFGLADRKKSDALELEAARDKAVVNALNTFNTNFIDTYFEVDTSKYAELGASIDELSKLLADPDTKPSTLMWYKARLQTTIDNAEKATGTSYPPVQTIINDIMSTSINTFNTKYATMGVFHSLANLSPGVL
jgi:hypothetical protein